MPEAADIQNGTSVYLTTPVQYNNSDWMLDGPEDPSSGDVTPRIWNSTDGGNWTVVDNNPPDVGPLVATNNKLWLYGFDGVWSYQLAETPTVAPTMTSTPTISPTFTPTTPLTPTSSPTFTPTYTVTPTSTPNSTLTATPTQAPIETAQATVGASGASPFLSNGTGAEAGSPALTQGTLVTVSEYSPSAAPSLGSFQSPNGDIYTFSAVTSGGVNVSNFAPNAVTLVFSYNPSQIPTGYTASQLQVNYFDGTNWNFIPATLDTIHDTLTVVTNHFSVWGVFLYLITPTPAQTLTSSQTPL
ncbi:MAG TPA: hypothetical protein VK859_12765, partial [bacterium]|nr:hypothetical protein [bacterium]